MQVLATALLALLAAVAFLLVQARSRLAALRATADRDREEAERRLEDATAAKDAESKARTEGLEARLAQQREAQEAAEARLREAHANEVERLREAHAREIAQLREAHAAETAQLRGQAERDAEAARRNLEQTVRTQEAALSAKLAEIQKALSETSNRSVKEGSAELRKDNLEQIGTALAPFKEQLAALQKALQGVHEDAATQKQLAERQFADMMRAAQGVQTEAGKLASALHGGAKVQGNWGEMVLDNILSASGLRQGEDYVQQTGAETEGSGIPDVVVNLPDGKKIVVDSKVVLTHWQNYLDADTDERREACAKDNDAALRKQIAELARKDYPSHTAGALPYTLLFVPVEASYALAMRRNPHLFMEAFAKRVVIVSPATLVVTLEMVRQLWSRQRLERDLGLIAKTGRNLYNKFAGFAANMGKIRKSLDGAMQAYNAARDQLVEGKGNAVRTAAKFCKQLGIRDLKEFPADWKDAAGEEIEDDAEDAEVVSPESTAALAAPVRSESSDEA